MAGLSRREFLKGTAAVGTGCALAGGLGGALGGSSPRAFAEGAASGGTTERFSLCRMCMEAECGLILTERDGVVVDVRGNPEVLSNQGTMCPRGKSIIMGLYNPYRVKAPMKRTNPKKGMDEDPGWVEISWEEALDLVAEKFKPILADNPAELISATGFSLMDFWLGINLPIIRLLGWTVTGIPGSMCQVHYGVTMMTATFPTGVPDYTRAKYVVNIGKNGGANWAIATDGVTRGLVDNVGRGMKVVTIDPHTGMDGSFGEWVPIRPGEDTAFLLAMLHVIMYEEDRKDEWYLRNRTNAPYLIPEGGFDYYRNADGKPMMWDLDEGVAKPFDDEAFSDGSFDGANVRRIALEGHFTVDDVKVVTGYTFNKESIKDCTPEWAEERCTIPAKKIREITRDFLDNADIGQTVTINGHEMPLRGSCMAVGRGVCNHEDGAMADMLTRIVNEMVGALDVPGGLNGCMVSPNALKPDEDGIVNTVHLAKGRYAYQYPVNSFSMKEYFPHNIVDYHVICRNLLNPPKGIQHLTAKAMFVAGTNLVTSGADPEMIIEALSTKIPFMVTLAYDMDEMAVLSDVLLPVHSYLESAAISKNYGPQNCVTENCARNTNQLFRDPVDPMYDTRLAQDIFMQILEKASPEGLAMCNSLINESATLVDETCAFRTKLRDDLKLDLDKRYDQIDIFDRTLRSYYGDEYGIEHMRKHGFIDSRIEEHETYNYYAWPLNTSRTTFYLHKHWMNGQRLAKAIDEQNPEHKDFPPGFDLDGYLEAFDPTWRYETTYIREDKGDFDLRAFNYRVTTAIYRFGLGDQNPWLDDWSDEFNPYYAVAIMNSATAAKKGLESGDIVKIESFEGTDIVGRLCVTELVHPDAIGICGAFGRMVKTGLSPVALEHSQLFFNKLIKPILPEEEGTFGQWKMMCRYTWSIESAVNVKVSKL